MESRLICWSAEVFTHYWEMRGASLPNYTLPELLAKRSPPAVARPHNSRAPGRLEGRDSALGISAAPVASTLRGTVTLPPAPPRGLEPSQDSSAVCSPGPGDNTRYTNLRDEV